jgi:GTP-binding protein HflX
VAEADLVLHVIDTASPERERHMTAVTRVLEEVGASGVARLEVYNKSDLVGPEERARLGAANPGAIVLSARTGEGREDLLEAIAARLALDVRRVRLVFDPRSEDDRRLVARVYRDARVLQHIETDDQITLDAEVPRRLIERLAARDAAARES